MPVPNQVKHKTHYQLKSIASPCVHTFTSRASTCIKQECTEMQGRMDKLTTVHTTILSVISTMWTGDQ